MADYTSTQSGDWNSAATWGGGGYPSLAGDTATISAGHTVAYNVDSQVVLGKVTIAGTLRFSRTMSTELVVPASVTDEISVESTGTLDIGTSASPIPDEYHAYLTADFSSVGANTNEHPGYLVQTGGAYSRAGNSAKYRRITYPTYGVIEETFDGMHSPATKNLKAQFTGTVGVDRLEVFSYTVTGVQANMARTLYTYAMLSAGWVVPPTASELYLEAEYPSGVGTTTTARSANVPRAYWNKLSVTFTPAVTGTVTIKCYLAAKENSEYVLVEPALYLVDPGGADTVPNPNLVMKGSTVELNIEHGLGGARQIAVMPDGNYVYAESGGFRVHVFDTTGALVRSFGARGEGAGQLYNCAGVAVDALGNIYVADNIAGGGRVVIFNSSGVYQRQISVPDADQSWKDANFAEGHRDHTPYADGIAVAASGRIFVVDNELMRVVILENNGTLVDKHIGGPGTAPGKFLYPNWCALDHANSALHICNGFNRRIEVIDLDGNYLFNYGSSASFIGGFFGATGVTFNSSGDAVVCDAMMGTIQAFALDYDEQTGTYLYSVGEEPPTIDSESQQKPYLMVGSLSGICYDTTNDWLVVHSGYPLTPAIQCRAVIL